MGRKGLSYEEKRKRLLAWLLQQKSVFTVKELENKVPKLTGIVRQSIKDVLMSLVHDGYVENDKIGSGQFFWAFPSKTYNHVNRALSQVNTERQTMTERKTDLVSKKRRACEGREASEGRTTKMARITALRAEVKELDAKLSMHADNDPERFQKLASGAEVCKEAANRWTDNVSVMHSFYKKKLANITDKQFYQFFGLPQDIDYLS